MSDKSTTLWAASLYGARTKTGRVDLSEVDETGTVVWQKQVSIDEARDYAHHILEGAEAAETDELVFTWLTDEVKVSVERAAQMLVHLRGLRDKRRS